MQRVRRMLVAGGAAWVLPAVLWATDVYGIGGRVEGTPGVTRLHSSDVLLDEGQTLHGVLISTAGEPRPGVEIELRNELIATRRTVTDPNGNFAFARVARGTYQLVAGADARVVRAWTSPAAPPAAVRRLHWVAPGEVVRGQRPAPPWLNNLVRRVKVGATKPLVVGAVVTAAVGIPVAVHNIQQDDAPPMSP